MDKFKESFEKYREKMLTDWDTEQDMGDPRFYLKHALAAQNYFLQPEGNITDDKGRSYGVLQSIQWQEKFILVARIKMAGSSVIIVTKVDTREL